MPRKSSIRFRPAMSVGLGALAVLLVLTYAAYVAYPLIRGPVLSVAATQTNEGTTLITGTTERVSKLEIDDLPVPLSPTGTFSVERTYPPGYTEVTVRSEDRFGRVRTQGITFVITPHASKKSEDGTGSTTPQTDRSQ